MILERSLTLPLLVRKPQVLCSPSRELAGWPQWLSWYCWWKKSQTTTWYVWNPVNWGGVYHITWCQIFSINSILVVTISNNFFLHKGMVSIDESHWVIIWVRYFCPWKWNQYIYIYVYVIVAGSVWMHWTTRHLQVKKNRGMVSMMVRPTSWFSANHGDQHVGMQMHINSCWSDWYLVMSKWAKRWPFSLLFPIKTWAICATASKLNTFQLIHRWEKDLLIQVSKFYCWCGAVDPMIHMTKRLKNAFGLQIVSTSFEDGWTKTTRVWRVSISSSKKPTLSPHPKTEQDSLHAPEICFKLLCSRLLEASCTTLIILTIRSLKRKHHLRTDPLLAWLSPAEEVWFCPSNLQCSPRPQNHKGVRLLGAPWNDRK